MRDAVIVLEPKLRHVPHHQRPAEFTAQEPGGPLQTVKCRLRVIVRVEKPGAVRFTASVGVEIERGKAD